MKTAWVFALVASAGFASSDHLEAPQAPAGQWVHPRASLRGLEEIHLEFSCDEADEEARNKFREDLRSHVEPVFHDAGISTKGSPEGPTFLVIVRIVHVADAKQSVYCVEGIFGQEVSLLQDPSVQIRATTFGVSTVQIVPTWQLHRKIRSVAESIVRLFAADHQQANPGAE